MRAGNPGATVQTSPLDRIQQRRAVLLSVLNGHRPPRGPRLPLRGKHVSSHNRSTSARRERPDRGVRIGRAGVAQRERLANGEPEPPEPCSFRISGPRLRRDRPCFSHSAGTPSGARTRSRAWRSTRPVAAVVTTPAGRKAIVDLPDSAPKFALSTSRPSRDSALRNARGLCTTRLPGAARSFYALPPTREQPRNVRADFRLARAASISLNASRTRSRRPAAQALTSTATRDAGDP